MFRPVSSGDWAADDEDEAAPSGAPTPPPPPANAWKQGPPPELGVSQRAEEAAPPARGDRHDRNDRAGFARGEREPLRGRWARPAEGEERDRREGGGGGFRDREQDRDRGFDRGFDRGDRDRGYDRGFDRGDRGFDRGDRGFDRGDRGGFDRDRGFDRGDRGGFDRGDRGYDRGDRDRGFDRGFDRGDRVGFDRRDRRDMEPPAPLPIERGVVISLRDNFGFMSRVDHEGDIFFHISEAPVDVQLQDECEFRVHFNSRSQKDQAVQLVKLPPGSIVWEDVDDAFVEGTVTKGIPRSSFHGSYNSSREEPHGLIEVRRSDDEHTEQDATAAETETEAAPAAAADEAAPAAQEDTKKTHHRVFVRYTAESSAKPAEEEGAAERPSHGPTPRIGDEVRFRIATHRRTGVKRAVELTITSSARDKLDKEMDAKLQTMTREQGVVQRLSSGGGFIRCCDRTDEVFFPLHELRKSIEDTAKPDKRQKLNVREGDEVSFFAYEDRNAPSKSSRFTGLRVVVLPPGSVCFQELLREGVQGVVTKAPRESRNGPEILGLIRINEPAKDVAEDEKATPAPVVKEEGTPSKTKRLKKVDGVGFHLSDISDTTYVAAIGDVVVFDEVLDKRTGRNRAANVRLVSFNPLHREQGVISAMKADFGFIKCADRASDAYFRFSDVMSLHADFRISTEVAFDVHIDNAKGGDNVRATRIEILAPGSVQWESVLEADAQGAITLLPSRAQAQRQPFGGRGPAKPTLQRAHNGRIRAGLSNYNHLVEVFPQHKAKVDDAFLCENEEPESENEIRVVFAPTLSKYERAAIHEYCDWLELSHESSGDGPSRHLEVYSKKRVSAARLQELQATMEKASTDVEFRQDDLKDVRYNPHVGDRVKLTLVLVKRTKQVLAKDVVLVEAASKKDKAQPAAPDATRKESQKYASLPKGEGIVLTIKPEGFGFIQPADQSSGNQENLFFHVKEILTGQGVAELKPGMEVQFSVSFDEKRKKSRAVGISVVPDGTITKVEVEPLRGIVVRPSLLRRLRSSKPTRGKNEPQTSFPGRIRVERQADINNASTKATGEQVAAASEEEEKPKRAPKKEIFTFFIHDIADPSVVVREGDEVEFIPQATAKGVRATKVRMIQSHAKEGVVVRVIDESHGVIRIEGTEAEEAIEVPYTSRNVLRGDVLKEGDRVQFALSTRPPEKLKASGKGQDQDHEQDQDAHSEDEDEEKEKAGDGEEVDATDDCDGDDPDTKDSADQPDISSPFVATSVLCLEPGSETGNRAVIKKAPARPENRSVNATLRQAMRQVGATAESRMAKGPDGTKGFKSGWRPTTGATAENEGEVDVEVEVEAAAVTETDTKTEADPLANGA